MSPVYILLHSMDNSPYHEHQMIKKLLDAYSTLKNLWVGSEPASLFLKPMLSHLQMSSKTSQAPSTVNPMHKISISTMNTIKVE